MAAVIGAILGAIPGISLWIWTNTWDDNNPDIGLAQLFGWAVAILVLVPGARIGAIMGPIVAGRLLIRTIKHTGRAAVVSGLIGGIIGAGAVFAVGVALVALALITQ